MTALARASAMMRWPSCRRLHRWHERYVINRHGSHLQLRQIICCISSSFHRSSTQTAHYRSRHSYVITMNELPLSSNKVDNGTTTSCGNISRHRSVLGHSDIELCMCTQTSCRKRHPSRCCREGLASDTEICRSVWRQYVSSHSEKIRCTTG